jgi:hypothetical protein
MTQDTITLIVLGALGAVMLASQIAFKRWLGAYRVVRHRVVCPARGTEAVVDFLIDVQGPEVFRDVMDCSLLARGAPTDCGKTCRSTSVASFGAVNGEASVSG